MRCGYPALQHLTSPWTRTIHYADFLPDANRQDFISGGYSCTKHGTTWQNRVQSIWGEGGQHRQRLAIFRLSLPFDNAVRRMSQPKNGTTTHKPGEYLELCP